MNVHEKETSEVTAVSSAASTASASLGAPAWQTPEYTVVETSLEVTAYRLADR
ncbi:pyrroloquinoline quinone precursor peptide PqqA [Streptomyces aurantiacus]|uniref:Coenzyme PQQ synthesis protein A n=1 Tax=Streptomyces aurantiacus JA 4570 TaxID=1286094 RepID=S3ZAV8_9ACTN|nr:pyrroloquinoline quinone precursor peptide PqqA [Streptomyces aurantiacus]EPH39714.1 hypothetical protein STRAU_7237 [Streptomyces aurantiacus JA 4570]